MSRKRLIWPFDPYIEDMAGDKKVGQFLKKIGQYYDIDVTPVYVSSSDFIKYSSYVKPSDFQVIMDNVTKDCKSYLDQIEVKPELKSTVVLDNPFVSQSAEIIRFEKYVEIEKPDFVVMASHGRKGWSRSFLGSFTESFLRRTETPTFVINAKMDCEKDLERALLPVEIDDGSQKFVEHFLDQHSLSFVKSLELFNKLTLNEYANYSWMPSVYGGAGYGGEDIIVEAKKRAIDFLSSFLNHPLSQKRLVYYVSDSFLSVSEAINKQVKDGDRGLVIIRSQAGPVERRILGSFTQDVIRNSSVPVLVYPYNYQTIKGD